MPDFTSPYWQGRIAADRKNLEAFQEGYAAYEDGRKVSDNPNPIGTDLYNQWDKGWHQAQQDDDLVDC